MSKQKTIIDTAAMDEEEAAESDWEHAADAGRDAAWRDLSSGDLDEAAIRRIGDYSCEWNEGAIKDALADAGLRFDETTRRAFQAGYEDELEEAITDGE